MSMRVLVTTHGLPVAGRLRDAFEAEGYEVDLVTDPDEVAPEREPRLLILTAGGGDHDPGVWVSLARDTLDIPFFTLLGGSDAAERGQGRGADEVFEPDPDPDEVVLLAHRTIERRRLQRVTGIVGESDEIREILERVVQIAPVDSTALITGESGTGKELVARGIHALSPRRHKRFLAVNVAALPETLLESELFGHEKGAFTGAIDSRRGFFELADRGTLFLDEIGEMPLSTQTKLLRVLEQREFLRVGGEQAITVDVRIIAATNQELRALVPEGRFRRDLYYRLNILGIELPPLRERRSDIPLLVQHFVRELVQKLDRAFPGLSDDAMELLVRYDWPGNVRELRNLVESMVVLAPGKPIGPQDLPREIRFPREEQRLLPAPIGRSIERVPSGRAADDDDEVSEGRRVRPELEFLFRTLVDLRMDVDQLRREFEIYRDEVDEKLDEPGRIPIALPSSFPDEDRADQPGSAQSGVRPDSGDLATPVPGPSDGEEGGELRRRDSSPSRSADEVVFRPGMTMEDLEREAIRTVLREVGGNRRKAADSLGIGERTLYRKIRKYDLDE
ncbi:MAG: sigma 54-interacting transcriptional regulator [Gemmatimonadota bacterium]